MEDVKNDLTEVRAFFCGKFEREGGRIDNCAEKFDRCGRSEYTFVKGEDKPKVGEEGDSNPHTERVTIMRERREGGSKTKVVKIFGTDYKERAKPTNGRVEKNSE